MSQHILVIDDKLQLCKSLQLNFEELGYRYSYALHSTEALYVLQTEPVDIVLLDLSLGREDGLKVLSRIRTGHPEVPVIMITGFGSIDSAVHAIKAGAIDYVQKPLTFDNLLKIVESNLKHPPYGTEDTCDGMITESPALLGILGKARRLAMTDFPVLITGESGTGKEHLARFIHKESMRKNRDMQSINCASFPDNLLDNELFGHEKGSYTGADSDFQGIFERAHNSSLFMDELGDMSLQTQAKILRTLQNHEIRRIGGQKNITIDVRFIGATNRDLNQLIEQKRFREDLYYRLSTAVLTVPPLRQRPEDILPLARHFLHSMKGNGDSLSQEVEAVLLAYDWPGNIRELKNTIRYASTLCESNCIQVCDLPQGFSANGDSPYASQLHNTGGKQTLEDMERDLILKTLRETNDNKKIAAEKLQISRKTLYNKLERYAIH